MLWFCFKLINGTINALDLLKINVPQKAAWNVKVLYIKNYKIVYSSYSPENMIFKLVNQAHCLVDLFGLSLRSYH